MTIGTARVIGAVCRPDSLASNSAQTACPQPEIGHRKHQDIRENYRTLTRFGAPCRVDRVNFGRPVCGGIGAGHAVPITQALRVSDSWENSTRAGLTVSGKSFRNFNSRFRIWQLLAAFTVAGFSWTVLLALVSCKATQADDFRPWMVPGRVVLGLSDVRNRPSTSGPDDRWMATVPETAWQFIIIHHSASESGSVKSIHKEHLSRKDAAGNPWLGIGYHFVIGNGHGMNDGSVEPTFRWDEQIHGAHSGNAMFNTHGIGICLIGNFEKARPTKAQLKSVRDLVRILAVRHRISRENLMGHASVKATACPGKHFPLNDVRMVIPERQS